MDSTPEVSEREDELLSSPPTPPSAARLRGALWETVLDRSLRSGDTDRVSAAIDLADAGGASHEVLASARRQLAQLADLSLAKAVAESAGSGVDAASKDLRLALEMADEAGASASALYEAQQEMQRHVDAQLARVLEAARSGLDAESREKLGATIARSHGADTELLADARSELAKLRAAERRSDSPEVFVDVGQPPSCSRKPASRSGWSRGRVGGSSLPRWSAQRALEPTVLQGVVPPSVIGRVSSSDHFDALESGLLGRRDFMVEQRIVGVRA